MKIVHRPYYLESSELLMQKIHKIIFANKSLDLLLNDRLIHTTLGNCYLVFQLRLFHEVVTSSSHFQD